MENYCWANKEIWDLGAEKGINRRARKLGGNLGQGKGRERKARAVGGSENKPPGRGRVRGKGGEWLLRPEIPPPQIRIIRPGWDGDEDKACFPRTAGRAIALFFVVAGVFQARTPPQHPLFFFWGGGRILAGKGVISPSLGLFSLISLCKQ